VAVLGWGSRHKSAEVRLLRVPTDTLDWRSEDNSTPVSTGID